jgi:hypothetical protein
MSRVDATLDGSLDAGPTVALISGAGREDTQGALLPDGSYRRWVNAAANSAIEPNSA